MEQPPKKSPRPPFLERVVLNDYKSIAHCDVSLSQFTILVGLNGAGKSNFLDALRFVADALRTSLDFAVRERGGIKEIGRKTAQTGRPSSFSVLLEANLPNGGTGSLEFTITAVGKGGVKVSAERCTITAAGRGPRVTYYEVREGRLDKCSQQLQAAVEPDRLYLGAISGVPEFRPFYDALSRMGFYNFAPDRIRDLQDPDAGDILLRDGRNIASILERIAGANSSARDRIQVFLRGVVPGVAGVNVKHLGPKDTLEFLQEAAGDSGQLKFLASNMSDGTLRVLGVLVALFQGIPGVGKGVSLIGIEEPEVALHPGAAETLVAAIVEASSRVQVLITSHSPDLLDSPGVGPQNLLAVACEGGQTRIGPLDKASLDILRRKLFTPGELLRLQQIEPEVEDKPAEVGQPDLFTSTGEP